MARFSFVRWRFVLALAALAASLAAPAFAASTINQLPSVSGTGTYPLPASGNPASATQNLWMSQGNGDFRITPEQLGYILQTTCTSIAFPIVFEQCIDTSVTPRVLKIWLGSQWVPMFNYDTTNQAVFQSTIRSVTGNATIAVSDCGNEVAMGGNIQATFTVPAANTFPTGCRIKISNTDDAPASGGHGKVPNGVTLPTAFLYPGPYNQSVTITNTGTKWVLSNFQPRWKAPTGTLTIYTNASVGSDNNDGLSNATPMRNLITTLTRYNNDVDQVAYASGQTQLLFQSLSDSVDDSSGCVHFSPHVFLGAQGGAAILIDGGGHKLTCTSTSALAFFLNGNLQVQNFILQSTAACLTADYTADIQVNGGMHFGGSAPGSGGSGCGQFAFSATDKATIRLTATYDFDGPYQFHMVASGAGAMIQSLATFTATGTAEAINTFAITSVGGIIAISGITFSAPGTTGSHCSSGQLSGVFTKTGSADADLPGNAASTTFSGGQCNSQNMAPLNGAAFGSPPPTAPTGTRGDTSAQIATDAFVTNMASQPGDGLPVVDGTAARGVSLAYARADHIHPTDTTRAFFVAQQAFSPTDTSGAGLTFTAVSVQYSQIGNDVHIYGTITYPATGNANNSQISLPIACAAGTYGQTPGSAAGVGSSIAGGISCIAGQTNAMFQNITTLSRINNSTLGGQQVWFNLLYPRS